MNRDGSLTRRLFRIALLVLLAVSASSADASEQEIWPDVRWFHNQSDLHRGLPSLEAALADYNSYRASHGLSLISTLQPCPGAPVYNGLTVGYCWPETDPNGNPQLVGAITPYWECPAEAPGLVKTELAPSHYRMYCRASQTPQPPPPDACDDTCVGNPIQVNTQIKIQRDFDIGLGSLRFDRVYTSSTGEWRHNFSTRAWSLELNSLASLPNNSSPGCFSGTVSLHVPKQRVCLPYVSNSDLGRTGGADWLVQRTDGRAVGISSVSQRSIDAGTREAARAVLNGSNFDGLVVYDGRDTVEFFDREGRLTRRSPLQGGGVVLTYLMPSGEMYPNSAPACAGLSGGQGTAGRPSCVTDVVTGRQLLLAYDAGGSLTSVTDPSGQSVSYQYNGPTSTGAYPGYDALTTVTYSDLTQRTYHYNEASLTSNAQSSAGTDRYYRRNEHKIFELWIYLGAEGHIDLASQRHRCVHGSVIDYIGDRCAGPAVQIRIQHHNEGSFRRIHRQPGAHAFRLDYSIAWRRESNGNAPLRHAGQFDPTIGLQRQRNSVRVRPDAQLRDGSHRSIRHSQGATDEHRVASTVASACARRRAKADDVVDL